MDVKHVLDEAANLLERHGHVTKVFHDEKTGSICLNTALAMAAGATMKQALRVACWSEFAITGLGHETATILAEAQKAVVSHFNPVKASDDVSANSVAICNINNDSNNTPEILTKALRELALVH
jgi:hypothetical protein